MNIDWGTLEIPNNSALVIVDLQKGFMNYNVDALVPLIINLIDERGGEFSSVIATSFSNAKISNFRKLLGWHELSGPPETELVDGLWDRIDLVVTKHGYSAHNEIKNILLEVGVENVFLVGLDTEACVLATAIGLFDEGFVPKVIANLCASSRGFEYHHSALRILEQNLGGDQVVSLSVLD
jgi:nicotinamidase-related amidase